MSSNHDVAGDGISGDRWREVTEIVDAALELSIDKRESFIAERCAGESVLIFAVHRLLLACERAENDTRFLATPPGELVEVLANEIVAHREHAEAAVPAIINEALRGHYTIHRELGRGGMATVFLARDERHSRDVAIKVLRPDLSRELGAERFLLEIEIAAGLQHPNILPVFDSGDADGLLFYIMPFVAGESLQHRLDREGQLTVPAAMRLAREVASALDHAHARGIVHRDVKPGNILLEGDHALVADFGVAKALSHVDEDRLTDSGVVVGTTVYMSPEQAAGATAVDGRSDVYSLACVVYEMLAGEPPYTGTTPHAILAKHVYASVPDIRIVRPTLGAAAQSALAGGLAKLAADRYASAGEFVDALQASLTSNAEGRTRRRAVVSVGGAITFAAALAYVAFGRDDSLERVGRSSPAADFNPPRVAVLYFDDLTPDTSLRHVADGLTEELIYELSGVNAFRVISKGGVKPFRGKPTPMDSIVELLGVTTVVDGSLQRVGSQLRALVQLIDAKTNTIVDRISLTGSLDEFITLERDVAREVAVALRRRMGRDVALRRDLMGTQNSRAAELVLQARRAREDAARLAEQPHPKDRKTAVEALERADSLLASAHAVDSGWVRPLLDRGWVAHQRALLLQEPNRREASGEGLRHVSAALKRAPSSAEALELRGTLRWVLSRDLDSASNQSGGLAAAEADLLAAVERDSTRATAWATLSWVRLRQGEFAAADLAAERALREDAYLSDARQIYEQAFYSAVWNGNLARASEWCSRGRQGFPGDWRFVECELTLMREDTTVRSDRRAWEIVAELERIYPTDRARLDGNSYSPIYWRIVAAGISARSGRRDIARAEITRARRATMADSVLLLDLLYDEAYVQLMLSERGEADRLLRQLVRHRPGTRAQLSRDPLFRGLQMTWLRGAS